MKFRQKVLSILLTVTMAGTALSSMASPLTVCAQKAPAAEIIEVGAEKKAGDDTAHDAADADKPADIDDADAGGSNGDNAADAGGISNSKGSISDGAATDEAAAGDATNADAGVNPDADPDAYTASDPDTDPAAEADEGTDTDPAAEADKGTDTDPAADADEGTDIDPDADTDTDADADAYPGADTDTNAGTGADPDAGTAEEAIETESGGSERMLAETGAATVPATGVKITTKVDSITFGSSAQFRAAVEPANATDKSVVWRSGDETIAKVDQNGKVTAVSVGNTYISVEHTEDYYNYYEDYYEIHVVPLNIGKASITGITDKVFTGKEIEQKPVIRALGKTLKGGDDYFISYSNNLDTGTAKVIIEGIGNFGGKTTRTFTISKAKNRIATAAATLNVPQTLLKEKKKTNVYLLASANENPRMSYKLLSAPKKAGKKLKLNSKGKITLTKGIKSGTYKLKVRITAAATKNYKKTTVVRNYKIVVKKQLAKYKSFKKLGVKGYSSDMNRSVNRLFEDMILFNNEQGKNFLKLKKLDKAYAITWYIATHYSYGDGSYSAESMIEKGYGTCYAYADLTYLMAKKAGLKQTWQTLPGRFVMNPYHKLAVTKIGKKYYMLDSNRVFRTIQLMQQGGPVEEYDFRPQQISAPYAKYLIGKTKKIKY